jgi:hypothetical protein
MTQIPLIKIYCSPKYKASFKIENFPLFHFLPPISCLDLYKDIDEKNSVIGIVDHEKSHSLKITNGEIADALRAGIRLYGSSEIGVLRALQSRENGMIGCGEIFKYLIENNDSGEYDLIEYDEQCSISNIDFYFKLQHYVKNNILSLKKASFLFEEYRRTEFHNKHLKLTEMLKIEKIDSLYFFSLPNQSQLDFLEMLNRMQNDLNFIFKKNKEIKNLEESIFNNSKCDLLWK